MTSTHNRVKIFIDSLKVLVCVFKSFLFNEFNQDINSFCDHRTYRLHEYTLDRRYESIVWNTKIWNNLCYHDIYNYLGGVTMIRNIKQTLVGAVMEEEISYSQKDQGSHHERYSMYYESF